MICGGRYRFSVVSQKDDAVGSNPTLRTSAPEVHSGEYALGKGRGAGSTPAGGSMGHRCSGTHGSHFEKSGSRGRFDSGMLQ